MNQNHGDPTDNHGNEEEDPLGQLFKGVFNKEKFDELRRETTKKVAPIISDMAHKIEKEAKIEMPSDLKDSEKLF